MTERTLDTRRVIHTFQGEHSAYGRQRCPAACRFVGPLTKALYVLPSAGRMVASIAQRTASLTPQTANTSLEEEAGWCSGVLLVLLDMQRVF